MKVLTIVGARPQFIKAAVVSHELRKKHEEIIVHTGQHFDYNMSEQFFDELDIPTPNYNLGISGGTHAQMTGKMLIALEEVIAKEKPDWVIVYGDTNSTLAGALAAAKLHIKICHVEAGARTHSLTNPEELNRVCVDHISSLLLASTHSCIDSLSNEGLLSRAHFVGDPMFDAFLEYRTKRNITQIDTIDLFGGKASLPESYYYLTCHREENTQNDENLIEILKGMQSLDRPTVYPVHPRNKERCIRIAKELKLDNIQMIEPVGYMENLAIIDNSIKIVTDSGGVQREAFFAGKKCVTVLDFVVWPETMVDGRNSLARPLANDVVRQLSNNQIIRDEYKPFGDGHSALKIVDAIEKMDN